MMRLLVLAAFAILVGQARAQNVDYVWLNPNGGDFNNPALWTPFDPPPPPTLFGPGGASDRVHFGQGVSPPNRYTVTNVDGVNDQMIVHNDSLTLEISGDDYEVDSTAFGTDGVDVSLIVGDDDGDVADVLFTGESGALLQTNFTVIGREGTGTVTVDDLQWNSTEVMFVGLQGHGTLNIRNGAVVPSNGATLALLSGTTGMVTVEDTGSTWANSNVLRVGELGDGTLNIQNGGTVSNDEGVIASRSSSESEVLVTGSGSMWTNVGSLTVGREGNGSIEIRNGASVSSNGATIAEEASSTSSVLVSGGLSASTWTHSGFLTVGDAGTATLTIQAGGQLVSSTLQSSTVIAAEVGSVGTVNLVGGSTWSSSFTNIRVGFEGFGSMNVESNSDVDVQTITLGDMPTGHGIVIVNGNGSRLDGVQIGVGNSGVGTLRIQEGGSVSSVFVSIGKNAGSDGFVQLSSLSVNSSRLTTISLSIGGDAFFGGGNGGLGALSVGRGSTVTVVQDSVLFPNGVLSLAGGTFTTDTVSFDGGGDFSFISGVLHVQTFNGDLDNQGGILAPGESAGSTAIVGDYTQQAFATLEVEIGGPMVNTEYDVVNVTGNAFLGGELKLALIEDYVPPPELTFTVFSADNLLNFFSNVTNNQRLDTAGGEGSFLVHYGPGSVFDPDQIWLSAFMPAGLPGDYNGDGFVNAADYTMWRDHLGTDFNLSGNGDETGGSAGIVDQADYDLWVAQFGETVGSGAADLAPGDSPGANYSVPEPATALLCVFGLAGILGLARWRS